MVFNSLQFVWFFIVVYCAYRLLPHRGQNWLLLVASYYFYAAWDWRFLGLLIASTLVDFTCARALARTTAPGRRRALLILSLGFNLTLLGFFKYFNFFADSLHDVFGALGWNLDFVTLRILLPVGISFYTFVTMSYVIDVYRREIPATRDLLDFAVFVAFFPHLVAGPILRASNLLSQIDSPRRITTEQMRDGAWLIAWGYFQKIYVADNLAGLVNGVFDPGAPQSGVNILLGVYAFAFQIYGDFAGYTNIARGTSKLMGIELIENFRFPYLVRTPQAFWRNWHISLSTWLRDYLYIPLGGSRGIGMADPTELVHHDGARRTVAWRRVDVRALGDLPRPPVDRIPCRRTSCVDPAGGCRRPPGQSHRVLGGDVPHHLLWLVDFPRPIGRPDSRSHDTPRRQLRARNGERQWTTRPAPALYDATDRRACMRGVVRRRTDRAAAAHRRAILHLRGDVLPHVVVWKLRRGRIHLFSVLG